MSSEEADQAPVWSEADSDHFIDFGHYFVPERELQLATICKLVPPPEAAGPVRIVELCCGEGLLSRSLLEAFPQAEVLALDGSPRMLEAAGRTAGPHAARLRTERFDIAAADWRDLAPPPQAVVSSLAVHHLDGEQKCRLYADMTRALAPGGALIIADIIAPAGTLAERVAADAWDDEVRRRAQELDGNLAAFEQFQADNWNLFSDPDPDPGDKPSSIYDQLRWMEEAGLVAVDVYWMKAGHVILGGRKPPIDR